MAQYLLLKEVVAAKLSMSQEQIHISFDMWTSGNQLALRGILTQRHSDARDG